MEPLPGFEGLVGRSAAMAALFDRIRRVAPYDVPVLILGETGTGKELVAAALHRLSRRRASRFEAVNCGALTRELLRSELFGHERGAFTGAVERRPGLLREADGGTVFLDEVGELPLTPRRSSCASSRGRGAGGGREPRRPRGRPADRGDASRLASRGGAGGVPRGPLLPARRVVLAVPPLRARPRTCRCWSNTSAAG